MSDDETPKPMSADADTDTEPAASGPDGSGPDRGGVAIPSWLAGALVIVLALLVLGAGFAIGRATAPDHDGFRPIVATEGGGPGGPGGLPGFPGGPQGRGGDDEGPGARSGPDSDDDSPDTPAPSQLPGT